MEKAPFICYQDPLLVSQDPFSEDRKMTSACLLCNKYHSYATNVELSHITGFSLPFGKFISLIVGYFKISLLYFLFL